MFARRRDRLDDRRALDTLELFQFVLEALQPRAVIGTFP